MAEIEAGAGYRPRPSLTISVERLQRAFLWAFAFSGFLVFVEPSPYEAMFFITAFVFGCTGLRVEAAILPLFIGLMLFNLGGAFSLIPYFDDSQAVSFLAISFYMMFTCLFFACVTLVDTRARIETIMAGWIPGAAIAATLGILGALNVFGLVDTFARYGGRASGTFKDPNVLGPFLCAPAVFLVQQLLLGTARRPLLSVMALLPIVGGIFFAFSRGAWGIFIVGSVLMAGLTFITSSSSQERRRISLTFILAVIGLVVLLLLLLANDSTRALFEARATLNQDYDLGVQGRFGNQLRAMLELLDLPNGFGPTRFSSIFHSDPHNVYVNAFASYGWLGGLAYPATMIATFVIGWGATFKRTPWQRHYIALWSVTFLGILQGLQIDTDHWRHLWLQIGVTWGAGIAAYRYTAREKTRAVGSGAAGAAR